MILDLSMFLFFGCCRLLFQFLFVLVYFLHFIGHSLVLLTCPFLFLFYSLSEAGSDDSSELVSHQMAHPSLCRTRFPS